MNSRYYNPEWGRFINFDNYGGQVGELLSHNGYAYCTNNPVNMVDENGNEAILTTVTGILVLFLGVATILSIPQERYEEAANAVANIATTVSNSLSNIKEKATNAVKIAVVTGVTTIAKTLKETKKTEYWSADASANKIAPISYTDAQIRIATGKNVIASNQVSALKIAVVYPVRRLEIDQGKEGTPGYYWHYHVSMNYDDNYIHGTPHIWFEGPKLFDF